jgi:hypothetical protein
MLLYPLSVLRPAVSRDVGASKQRLEFGAQRTELFDEADVFGPEVRELFGVSQRI